MIIVVLDQSDPAADSPGWAELADLATVRRYDTSSLSELLDRSREADVLVTFALPLRREILDYVTKPRLIVTAAGRSDELVELPIARQLGIEVVELAPDLSWPQALATIVARR